MQNADLLPSLLSKLNENHLALETAILELTYWAEKNGGIETAWKVYTALETLDKNEDFINLSLAVLMTP